MKKLRKIISEDILSAGIENTNVIELSKVQLASLFLLGSSIVMCFTLIYRIFSNPNIPYILIDTFTSVGFFLAYLWLRKTKNLNLIINFSILFISIFMLIFIKINHNSSFGLVWSYTVPLFVIPLAGIKKGGFVLIVFYLFIFSFMYFDYDLWKQEGWDKISFIRYITVSFSLIILGSFYYFVFEKFQQNLYKLSTIDALTKIYNRRKIDEIMQDEIKKINTYDQQIHSLSICIFDIDDFKKINDKFGHLIGDRVLQEISEILKKNLREIDNVGRWGGEEFCIIIPKTKCNEAMKIVKRVQKSIKEHDFRINKTVTCSFGLTCFNSNFLSKEDLIKQADDAMYRAKKSGKDKIELFKNIEK